MPRLIQALLILVLLCAGDVPDAAAAQGSPPQGTQLLDTLLVGRPVVGGRYVFWLRQLADRQHRAIYGYDFMQAREFLVARVPATTRTLATDGTSVAWIEHLPSQPPRVWGYHVPTRQTTLWFEATSEAQLDGLALDAGVLFFHNTDPQQHGIVAQTLSNGQQRVISHRGFAPVARDGTLLWQEALPADESGAVTWTLHMQQADSTSTVLAQANGPFSAYGVSGDRVVWAAGVPAADRRVYLHQISTGSTTALTDTAALFPVIQQAEIAWTAEPSTAPTAASRWSIQRDTAGATPAVPVLSSAVPLATWGIASNGMLVLTAAHAATGTQALIAAARGQAALPDTLRPVPPLAAQERCGLPSECGQVAVDGTRLVDNQGTWDVDGIQFFLPQRGINTWTFHDSSYRSTTAEIERWLDLARDELHVQTLRIFVELPHNGTTPTSHATLFDFARRANLRGMRLGMVLQNSSDFRMTPERRVWLTGLITYFEERNALPLIAYVSAANEINNWCSRRDCFDNNPAYVSAALEWVAQFSAIFKHSQSGILTTVGLSTEVADSDGRPAWHNFVQPDQQGRTLASLTDFLAPHNYGGAGYAIIHDLRYVLGYTGPVVLEEYGFPTDPAARDTRYTEGAPLCRDDPWQPECVDTAPRFVEWSLRAIRETSYAGGVAWMLADVSAKQCGSDPPDLWTGLFASGYGYCGGTYTTATARPKATAYRVKLHHLWRAAKPLAVYLPQVGR